MTYAIINNKKVKLKDILWLLTKILFSTFWYTNKKNNRKKIYTYNKSVEKSFLYIENIKKKIARVLKDN